MSATATLGRRINNTLIAASFFLISSCYSYRVATHAQGATENIATNRTRAYSMFWGLLQKPQVIHTPTCDSMSVNGVSEVKVKANVGCALLTVFTLGIYCPVVVEWKCAKPCQQVGHL